MKNEIKITEHQLQTLLMNYLRAKGWYVMRLNSGKYSVGEGRNKRFIMGQEAGTPDLMAFKDAGNIDIAYPDLVFIEVKVPGNKPTRLQELKMKELEEYRARCIVAHSLEELQENL